MEKDLISIIVPVYNVESFIEKCIQSIIHQTYSNLEIILVDDGSTDNSGKICDMWEKKDKRIKVIHKINGGLSSARNAGLAASSGKYIGFIDSDDYVDSDMYELLHEKCVQYFCDICICGHYVETSDGTFIEAEKNDGELILYKDNEAFFKTIKDEIRSFAWDKLYKRELFCDFEYPNLSYHEDVASTHILIDKAENIVQINKAKYHYIRNDKSISHQISHNKYFDSARAFISRNEYVRLNHRGSYENIFKYNAKFIVEMGVNGINKYIRTFGVFPTEFEDIYRYYREEKRGLLRNISFPLKIRLTVLLLSKYRYTLMLLKIKC